MSDAGGSRVKSNMTRKGSEMDEVPIQDKRRNSVFDRFVSVGRRRLDDAANLLQDILYFRWKRGDVVVDRLGCRGSLFHFVQ